jgi:hypothetical protein
MVPWPRSVSMPKENECMGVGMAVALVESVEDRLFVIVMGAGEGST